ncbi:MAG: acyl-CoA/acyl-ACP dehydrogenase [Nitrososphaerota archaeon]|nr:acyl-CoA/acyl-ACP dehydrogenase [Nitrososphaerota archaeon]MDG6938938.1 acyl-CoA/acyl-ACP dehydrogenase [Nitrososphaerota archaeon]
MDEMIRSGIASLCSRYPAEYWRDLDSKRAYPEEFVREMARQGWLSVLIPREYGGGGGSLQQGSIILEEVNASGGNAAACHAQMYTVAALLRHGSEEQKRSFLPRIASGELRLQAFGITEPGAGSDTTRISTFARKVAGGYVVDGQKVFTSRVQHSDLMLLVARTRRYEEVETKTDGISLFLVDIKEAGDHMRVSPIRTMINHETNSVHIEDLRLDERSLIGEEGKGFRYLLDALNAERILIAAECVGDARWFIRKAVDYSGQRTVFGRPIGKNQGVQFPIAAAYARTRAADLMRRRAAELFDEGKKCGEESNIAKYLASEASWEAANVAMNVLGGYGMAADMDVERKFRENRLYMVAPVSNNLVLSYIGEHVLGLPRSF